MRRWLCVKAKKPYCGVCFSDCHRDLLEQWLVLQVFNEMRDVESKLYNADLAALFGEQKEGKRKAKAKAKAGKKPRKDDSAGGGGGEGGGDGEDGSSDAGE